MATGSPWTQEKKDKLIELWPDEDAATIADIVGRTRNAVIGMAHRLGLENKAKSNNLPRKKVGRLVPKLVRIIPAPPPPPVYKGPIPLLETKDYHCRAIMESDGQGHATVCGKHIQEGQTFSFCPEHLKQYTTRGYYR